MKRYLLLLLLPTLTFASIGKINFVKGDATITRVGKSLKVTTKSLLEKYDFIKTAGNSKVQIIFKDNTILTIGKNSTLDIADYLYDEKKPKINKAKFKILKGAFTSITGRIGKINKNKFKLKTKSASIGIRGTIVKANQKTVLCTQGAITVTTPNGVSVNVEAGEKTSIVSGSPTTPEAIKAGDEAKIGADITEEDKKDSKKQVIKEKEKKLSSEKQVPLDVFTSIPNISKEKNEDDKGLGILTNTDGTKTDQTGYSMKDGTSSDNFDVTINTASNTATSNGENLNLLDGDGTTSWGYWDDGSGNNNYKQVWVSGRKTSVGILDNLKNSSTTTTHNYSGQVIGNVHNETDETNEQILLNSDNSINLNFDLGGGVNNMDGNIKFKSENTSWNANFSGEATSGNKFESTSISNNNGDPTATDISTITEGSSLQGAFYGNNGEAVGGTFNLDGVSSTKDYKASGVFKAK